MNQAGAPVHLSAADNSRKQARKAAVVTVLLAAGLQALAAVAFGASLAQHLPLRAAWLPAGVFLFWATGTVVDWVLVRRNPSQELANTQAARLPAITLAAFTLLAGALAVFTRTGSPIFGQTGWAGSPATGLLTDIPAGILGGMPVVLLALLSALAAWDLDALARQLRRIDRVDQPWALAGRRVARLAGVLALGGLSGSAALELKVGLPLAAAMGLGLLAVLAVNFLVRGLRGKN